MFSRLDNYILKAFIPTFFMCLLIISGIYIVADLLQKLGEFVDMGSDALSTGMRYYMYLFPVIVFQFFSCNYFNCSRYCSGKIIQES